MTIDAESLILRDGARIEVNTFGEGSAGQLRVRSARIELIGTDAAGFPSGLFTDTVSTGDGGLLTIDAENLILRDGAQIVAGTSGEGNAGQLGVRSVRIELIGTSADGRSTSGLTTGTDSTGDGGLLMIDAESLILRDGAVIGSGTFGEGNAGQLGVRSDRIELIGTDAAGFPSGLFTFTSRGSTGDGGLLTIDANSLILHDGAVIQATTFGEGNAGEIGVRSDQIELMGTTADGLSSGLSTGTRSTGDGGLLTIDTESLILRDGAVISAETSGEGNAGQLRVRSDRIELIGTSVDGQFLSSLLTLSEGEGDANTLTVEAEDILLDNGRISAETEVSSQGAIELFVSDSLTLRNNAAITTSTENGVGGNLTIRADEVTLNSGSILNTEATGERGSAGSMFITADQLRLNNSALNADTFNTIGDARGNIILNTSALSLENSSNIRTNATGSEAIGGNITITSDVLTAVENSNITANAPAGAGGNITIDSDAIAALENSDITTNAAGQGGLITINTQGRFGLEQRSREELQTLLGLEEGQLTVDSPNQLPSSDITAISLQSPDLDGQVFFNEPDIDPSRGLIPLPADIVEVAEPSQGCQVTGQTGTGELFETGRGGLVPDPLQLLNSDATWDDIRDPSSIRGNTPSTATIPQPTAKNQRRTIIEAQSLEITANGDIKLTAPPFSTTSYQPLLHQNGCQPSVKNKNLSSPKAPEITVRQFEFIGNTVIPSEKLAEIAQTFTNKPLTFDQLLAARSEVSKFYINSGYITSGAIIPPQTSRDGVVTVEVIEGTLEDIKIATSGRLNPSYIRSRLNIEPSQPVNKNHLVKVLQLLQLDPIIERISAELSTGLSPGTSLLEVNVTEVPSFNGLLSFDNGRSPSVGSFQRGVRLGQTNLLGLGDTLSLEYNNSEGSNAWDVRYALPINSSNGTIQFNYSNASSNVVEPPFDLVDIEANSRTYELSYRQPIVRTVSNTLVEELAVGLRANHRESQTFLLGEDFPLSAGADENGETRVSALRFFQDWTQRGDRQVFAARSEFSLGVGLFDATVNDNEPDSQFLSWRGQGLWARLLAPDTKLIVRGDVQLSAGELLPLEQFGVGGLESVRGYRQDALLTDNGVLLSAEFEFPIFRSPKRQTIVQLIPFIDVGAGWNSDGNANPDRNVLLSTGLGLQLQLGKGLTARLDWGIPLVDIESRDRTWQENGLHFSLETRPF